MVRAPEGQVYQMTVSVPFTRASELKHEWTPEDCQTLKQNIQREKRNKSKQT